MASILDIKRRLEEHRRQLEEQREDEIVPKRKAGSEAGDAGTKRRLDREEEEPEPRRYEPRADTGRDLGMDELLREIKNREQKHLEDLKDEMSSIDDLKEMLDQMIKESQAHITELEGKLERYAR